MPTTEKRGRDDATCVRLLLLIRALDVAGACPVHLNAVHSFAYLSNVLSPLWDIQPDEVDILKDERGPYYSLVQHQMDCLIASNVFIVEAFDYVEIHNGRCWLDAQISLADHVGREIDKIISVLPDERELWPFLHELALAFAEIDPERQDDAALVDVTYSSPAVSDRRLVDFSGRREFSSTDASVQTARRFQNFAPSGVTLSRAEQLLMYVRLLKKRVNG